MRLDAFMLCYVFTCEGSSKTMNNWTLGMGGGTGVRAWLRALAEVDARIPRDERAASGVSSSGAPAGCARTRAPGRSGNSVRTRAVVEPVAGEERRGRRDTGYRVRRVGVRGREREQEERRWASTAREPARTRARGPERRDAIGSWIAIARERALVKHSIVVVRGRFE